MSDYNDGLIPDPCLRLDYGFGQQYASVELGDGTGYVRVTDELRSEYHRMKRWYDDELRAALAENAKLREVMEDLEECDQIHRTMLRQVTELKAKAKAENAKLRDLATGLYRCWLGEGCDGCPMQDSDGWCIRDLQLRELRIEVDG